MMDTKELLPDLFIFSLLKAHTIGMPHRNYYLCARTYRVTSRSSRSNKPSRLLPKDKLRNGKVWRYEDLVDIEIDNMEEKERLLWIEDEIFEREVEIPFENYLYNQLL